ncbi:MAG: hypothetical protein K0S32_702 [Bacteroidetes bacterium]|jgi:hypothetical protein|nr:hypothetical protein [Bacteroidota bacterium]
MKKVIILLNYFSVYWLILVFVAAGYTYLKYDVWPEYSNPDPKSVFLNSYELLFFSFIYVTHVVSVIFLANLVHLLYSYFKFKKVELNHSHYLFICNVIFLVISLKYPIGPIEWFMD